MTIDLQTAALAFGQEVQDLLDAVLPRPHYVPEGDRRVQVVAAERNRYSIRIAERRGLVALTSIPGAVVELRLCPRGCGHRGGKRKRRVRSFHQGMAMLRSA